MLGDTAVCVHPTDERYKHLIGKTVTIPLVNREIPIIADGLLADPTLGTGCVKVTPAHDPNDYACWQRHPEIGDHQHPEPGRHDQRERRQVRRASTATRPARRWSTDMEALGLFEGKEDREIPLKYSDRSKTPIEPYLSDQWFVKMGDRDDGKPGLAQMAMDAVTSGRVKFFPERYAKHATSTGSARSATGASAGSCGGATGFRCGRNEVPMARAFGSSRRHESQTTYSSYERRGSPSSWSAERLSRQDW